MSAQPASFERAAETSRKRAEWIRFGASLPELGPMDQPRVWLAWLDAHPHLDPVVFEKRDGGGRLVALLPFYRDGKELRIATDEHLDYQGIAARNVDDAAELLRDVVGFCLREGLVMTLGKVAQGSLLYRALRHPRVRKVAWSCHRYWSICPIGHYNWRDKPDVVAGLPRSRRRDYRVSDRKLKEAFPDLVVSHFDSGEIEPSLVDEIGRLHLEGPYGGEGQSGFRVPEFVDFLKRLGREDSGLLLTVAHDRPGGELLAFVLGFRHRETFLYYLTSFRQAESELSPGNWLLVEALKHHGDAVTGKEIALDLLNGREAYKKRWAQTAYQVDRYRVVPRGPRHLSRWIAISTVYRLKAMKNRLMGIRGAEEW